MKDRRDIGRVIFPIEKILAAREVSSCCVGVEALIEQDAGRTRLERIGDRRLQSFIERVLRKPG